MEGELSLDPKQDSRYQPMRTKQVLAAPHGLLRNVRSGSGLTRLSMSGMVADRSWTRFWLLGIVLGVRAGGNVDHLKSSFGPVEAETVCAPASQLPQRGVTWTGVPQQHPDSRSATSGCAFVDEHGRKRFF